MKQQAGFSIVMAIFILVVLSLLGSYMVKLSGVQHATSTYVIQGARAYQAARAGIEWSIARISSPTDCNNIDSAPSMSFADINDFSVSLNCSSSPYSEATDYDVYKITSLSEFGVYNSANYISRKIEVTIVN